MSYLVLARKYRPQNFAEVVGQEHIAELLSKSIESKRIAHAFLFTGPRGIGKTSCARILAKCLNCQNGPTLKPCGTCPACQEIAKTNSFDVLEIDGASNRGIDEIRTLRENVKFAPSYGRYKIYIVDEVHMLTQEAFNALLKTLEEPPEHVKFIFATTAPHKVPATIISRCQRFDFKRITIKTIIEQLSAISEKEKLKIDSDALYAVAKAAQGSLRDALSILDQLSALSDRQIKAEDVFSMLGMVETQLLFELVDALGQNNCVVALQVLEKIIDKGKDIKQLTRDLTEHFRHLMIIKIGGKALGGLVDYPSHIKDMLLTQSQQFTLPEILNAIDTLIETQETSRITESLRMPLEIAFAKLTFKGEAAGIVKSAVGEGLAVKPKAAISPVPSSVLAGGEKFTPGRMMKDNRGQVDVSGHEPRKENLPSAVKTTEPSLESLQTENIENLNLEKIRKAWDALTFSVSREKMSVATFLQEGIPIEYQNLKLIVGFPKNCAFQKESLESQQNLKLVERVFAEKLKVKIILQFKFIETDTPRDEEPIVKSILDTFQGKIVNRWHNE